MLMRTLYVALKLRCFVVLEKDPLRCALGDWQKR
jgi:hypothetical protein